MMRGYCILRVDMLEATTEETDTAIRFIGQWGDLAIRAWDMAGSGDTAMAVLGAWAAIDAVHAAATIRVGAQAGGATMIMITITTVARPLIVAVPQSGSTESLRAI
jgi:hypothetical protein